MGNQKAFLVFLIQNILLWVFKRAVSKHSRVKLMDKKIFAIVRYLDICVKGICQGATRAK